MQTENGEGALADKASNENKQTEIWVASCLPQSIPRGGALSYPRRYVILLSNYMFPNACAKGTEQVGAREEQRDYKIQNPAAAPIEFIHNNKTIHTQDSRLPMLVSFSFAVVGRSLTQGARVSI